MAPSAPRSANTEALVHSVVPSATLVIKPFLKFSLDKVTDWSVSFSIVSQIAELEVPQVAALEMRARRAVAQLQLMVDAQISTLALISVFFVFGVIVVFLVHSRF
jgi:hypothetical protein